MIKNVSLFTIGTSVQFNNINKKCIEFHGIHVNEGSGLYECLNCGCLFSKIAIKKNLKRKFGDQWEFEWKKLHRRKQLIRQRLKL